MNLREMKLRSKERSLELAEKHKSHYFFVLKSKVNFE